MREDIVREAEVLFASGGYRAASLKQIAQTVGMRPASLYYHFKGGKEEIYLAVIHSRARSYKEAIDRIASSADGLDEILREFAEWYAEQTPMNMSLVAEFDMPHLSKRGQKIAMKSVGDFLFAPLASVFSDHRHRLAPGLDSRQLVGVFATLLHSAHTSSRMSGRPVADVARHLVFLFLNGALKRS